jgi:hypothetical protein
MPFPITMDTGCAVVMGPPLDICKTPVLGVPVPIPYPNIAEPEMLIATGEEMIITCLPSSVLGDEIPISDGMQAGVEGGLLSEIIMGPAQSIEGSAVLNIGGLPAGISSISLFTSNEDNIELCIAIPDCSVVLTSC